MRFYEFKCPNHGTFDTRNYGQHQPCPSCGASSPRFYGSVTFGAVLHEHYNPAFGTVVRSQRHARELAKVASAEKSAQLGMSVDLEVVDAADPDVHKIDKAEMEHYAAETAKANA